MKLNTNLYRSDTMEAGISETGCIVESNGINAMLEDCLNHSPVISKINILLEHPSRPATLPYGDQSTVLVLNLADPVLAVESAKLWNTIYWVSDSEPQSHLGCLIEDYQGAFLNGLGEMVLQKGSERFVFECAWIGTESTQSQLTILAAVVAARLHGASAERIQNWLDSLMTKNRLFSSQTPITSQPTL